MAIASGNRLPAEVITDSLVLGAFAKLSEGAFGEVPSVEQEEICWRFAARGYREYTNGKVPPFLIGSLVAAWTKGILLTKSWGSFANSLPESFRPEAAFVLGCRLQRLNLPKEAGELFQAAIEKSEDPVLSRLAKKELARLQK